MVVLIRTVEEGEEILIEHSGYYWIKCWQRLSRDIQSQAMTAYPKIQFPPNWPHLLNNESQEEIDRLEHEYATMAKNAYSMLEDENGWEAQVIQPEQNVLTQRERDHNIIDQT